MLKRPSFKNIIPVSTNLKIYNYITQGIILCSKVDWYEHGEKYSKYFLNPISTGGGVFSTPGPVNGSELHNGTS